MQMENNIVLLMKVLERNIIQIDTVHGEGGKTNKRK